jgi:hypothetical protein
MSAPVFFSQSNYLKKENSYYNPIYGNYSFDTDLTAFGVVKERKFRKINRIQSVLKLKDDKDIKSIYPMLDEFGYSVTDFFIFKSTWDYEYHLETFESTNPSYTYDLSNLKFYNKNRNNYERVLIDWRDNFEINTGIIPTETIDIGRPIRSFNINRNDYI